MYPTALTTLQTAAQSLGLTLTPTTTLSPAKALQHPQLLYATADVKSAVAPYCINTAIPCTLVGAAQADLQNTLTQLLATLNNRVNTAAALGAATVPKPALAGNNDTASVSFTLTLSTPL